MSHASVEGPLTIGPLRPRTAKFRLPASKSLANRALVIRALAEPGAVRLDALSDAADTQTLARLLARLEDADAADGLTLDCGPAGTTFRFLTAYLCTRPGTQTLTGSARMLERPVGPLVDALRALGADIAWAGREGYPPLRVTGFGASPPEDTPVVTMPGDVSSQFLSAVLLIAPVLARGVLLRWSGELVSRPYLEMTAALMRRFGAEVTVDHDRQTVRIGATGYAGGDYRVESDWSAASYAAAWVALGEVGTAWTCRGLDDDSLQGDRQLTRWIAEWGVAAEFDGEGARFRKTEDVRPASFEADFETSPDLAQTFAFLCGASGVTGLFTGLQTLAIKETDRIAALQAELAKAGVFVSKLPSRFSPASAKTYYLVEGDATWEGTLELATYHDHRMAMAGSLLAARGRLAVEDPMVVAKSFPGFWDELSAATE